MADDSALAAQGLKRPSARDRILVAARQLIAQLRSSEFPLVGLCRAAGVSRSTFYRIFPTREALLSSLFDEALASFQSRVRARIAAAPEPARRIAVLSDCLAERLGEPGVTDLIRVDFKLTVQYNEYVTSAAIAFFLEMMEPVFDAADAVMEAPVNRTAAAYVFARFYTSLVLMREPPMPAPPAALIASTIRALTQLRC